MGVFTCALHPGLKWPLKESGLLAWFTEPGISILFRSFNFQCPGIFIGSCHTTCLFFWIRHFSPGLRVFPGRWPFKEYGLSCTFTESNLDFNIILVRTFCSNYVLSLLSHYLPTSLIKVMINQIMPCNLFEVVNNEPWLPIREKVWICVYVVYLHTVEIWLLYMKDV